MPGIVLVVSRRSSADEAAVERALKASSHRGEERSVRSIGAVALGILRREDGPQHASIHDGDGLVVAIAGRVDNIDDLARDLPGTDASSQLDAATVLHRAFRRFGEDVVMRLRGAFEGVISDGSCAWVFRDHMGFRPLFYRSDAEMFVAATEAKQVVAASGIASDPDIDVLEAIFFAEYDDTTPSALRGVNRLPKASMIVADLKGARMRRYWDPRPLLGGGRYDDAELQERFDALMGRAVARTLTGSDVVSLSGGLDSPTVAVFAAEAASRRFGGPPHALSAVYPDQPSVDETRWIEEVAGTLGLPLHTYRRSATPLTGLREWVRLCDGPIPAFIVNDAKEHYDHARAIGRRNMITGELAEFLVDQRRVLIPHLFRTGQWGPLMHVYRLQRGRGVGRAAFARQLALAFAPEALERRRLLKRPVAAGGMGVPSWLDEGRVRRAEAAHALPASERYAASQLAAFEGPGLSGEADEICQELCGVMSRRPWADVDLFEFFLSLPAWQKYGGDRRKDILRTLMRGRVPDSVLDRPTKTLFNASIMARIDYEELGRWLLDPPTRISGVRYDILADRLAARDLSLLEYQWAKDLAGVHAFLSLW